MDPHPDDPLPFVPQPVDEASLVPVERDRRFVFRLVAFVLCGAMAAAFVGGHLQHAVAGCGASLVRPGSTVIPPESPASQPAR